MPVAGSNFAWRRRPESTTTRTPSIVRLVSAMLVASTILRRPAGLRTKRRILSRRVELAIQRLHAHGGIRRGLLEGALYSADFRGTRQEAQNVSFLVGERAPQHLRRLHLERELGTSRDVVRRHLVAARVSLDDGRVIKEARERARLERRRHDQHAQILAQRFLALEAER